MRFDPAASSGTPNAIKTIPKNGGGKGKKANPISKQIAPANIKAIDFKCFVLCTLMPSDHRPTSCNRIIFCKISGAKRMFKDI
ncbi:hypothetical protein [Thalassospira sp.]|uniref:hypothetical protein n=1 Tax=Thalassospira sp. TaxID=1912094 RepID=UPI0032EBCA82